MEDIVEEVMDIMEKETGVIEEAEMVGVTITEEIDGAMEADEEAMESNLTICL
jgi:hypothetical protein